MFQLFKRVNQDLNKIAIVDTTGQYSYNELQQASDQVQAHLLEDVPDLNEARVGFLVAPGFDYVKVQWGIWKAGGIAVPLSTTHPSEALQHVIDDAQISLLIISKAYADVLSSLKLKSIKVLHLEELKNPAEEKVRFDLKLDRGAMILYTSGTTSKPKGVLTTFGNIQAQLNSLHDFWHWSEDDYILNVLPLHHVHGIINVVTCALWSGATVEFLSKFKEANVFDKFLEGNINVFMAVPTIYFKLISHFDSLEKIDQTSISKILKEFRLMVSGSAALPISVLEKWREISGHTLLERYGMTEIGMGLSNPYDGERRPGHVGLPFPNVEGRLMADEKVVSKENVEGEIQIKGPTVFKEYWGNPEATKEAFTEDGWFKTGDIAMLNDGYYKILGRNSVDIIKSGGYKISALEIEEVLPRSDQIDECAVVGLPDEEWGERIVAAIVPSTNLDLFNLPDWMKDQLPAYKVPRSFIPLVALPRNAMGKVSKNELKKMLTDL
ncbi:MAG: acyl-CoA synthetase [Cyclobacteriaceae bacterium]